MSQLKRVGDLQIEQDLPFERRTWLAERVGWVLMAALVAGAMGGLLGPGLLSRRTASAHGLELEYHKFGRYDASDKLVLKVAPSLTTSGEVQIRFSESYLGKIRVEDIEPEPDGVLAGGGERIFVFRTSELKAPIRITFHTISLSVGRLSGHVGAGDVGVEFSQWFYP